MHLPLGTTRRGRTLSLSDEERSRHIHLVGASGSGKSKLLESMIRRDIFLGRGLCLIDPHGTLADAILEWAAFMRLGDRRRIHVIDLQNEDWSAGFNPLCGHSRQGLEARVDAMVATCAEVWGGENLDRTPLLTTCLQLLFYALAAHRLTLTEALDLSAASEGRRLRERLVGDLPNPVHAAYWQEFQALGKREFEERFQSARRRLLPFLSTPSIRRMLGQAKRVLDLRAVMDSDEILIVNLAAKDNLSADNAQLVGALLLSEFFLCAMGRDEKIAARHPFSLYIDECYDYLTGDVERMLDQTRKFGLHVVLSHQRLSQLRKRSEAIYSGVMAGGQTKIVFGGLVDDDAAIVAREIFRTTLSLQRPKHILDKPVVVDELPYWLESESSTEAESRSLSRSTLSGWARSSTTTEGSASFYAPDEDEPLSLTASLAQSALEGSSGSTSDGWSDMRASSQTHGRSQTLKSVRVMLPTAVHSLEEELHLAIVKLRTLPKQAAIVRRPGKPPVRIRPATVRPTLAWPELIESFLSAVRSQSQFMASRDDAERELADRRDLLATKVAANAIEAPFWS